MMSSVDTLYVENCWFYRLEKNTRTSMVFFKLHGFAFGCVEKGVNASMHTCIRQLDGLSVRGADLVQKGAQMHQTIHRFYYAARG
jgi:hypothetical protein